MIEASFIHGYQNNNKSSKTLVNNAGNNDLDDINTVAGIYKYELIYGQINPVPHIDNYNKFSNKTDLPQTMEAYPRSQGVGQIFDYIRLYTYSNRRSVLSVREYGIYCITFSFKIKIKPIHGKHVWAIEGLIKALGEAIFQITFKYLNVIIEVNFLILQ